MQESRQRRGRRSCAWARAEAHTVHAEAHGAGAKTKFEAGTWVSVSVPLRRESVHTVPP